jgi:myo-inositol 2-dehydrogenase/D-chiro-inositol 1-dehydrogenase
MSPNSENLRFGIIGAGRIGKIHAQTICKVVSNASVIAIADPVESAAQETASKFGIPHCSAHFEDVLNNPDVDAVAICSSTNTHAEMITAAAEAGKHIFCEKPIAYDLSVIDSALAAVEKAGVKLQIGFNRRFDPNFRAVREGIAAGQIGAPHLLRITSRDPEPPPPAYVKVSGGMFFDMTIHDFDMARYLMGCNVTRIFAAGTVLVDEEIGQAGDIDTAVVTLFFENGAIGTIDNSRKAIYGYDQRLEVFGSGGMLQSLNNTPHRNVFSGAGGIISAKPLYFFLERYMDSFIAEMDAFVKAVRLDQPTPVSGADGREPVVMAIAATRSLKEKRPVDLSEIR